MDEDEMTPEELAQWAAHRQDCVQHCSCDDPWHPCDGVMAGGVCDQLRNEGCSEDEDW